MSIQGIGAFVLVVVSVWLGWQVIREFVAVRLPPAQALSLSPGSPAVLSGAAEAEFAAKRFDEAEELAQLSLAKAPFSVRALRVLGLTVAEKGQRASADDIITLAGNWSLRDDPSHVWLINYRLSRGDYSSAFSHADTLARRRADLYPDLFRLFSTAATLDPRAIPPLTRLLAASPPWRKDFFAALMQTDEDLALAANLAIALPRTGKGAFTTLEIGRLYDGLMRKGQIAAMAEVRRRLGQPAPELALVNGEFNRLSQPAPYEWRLFAGPGMTAEILTDAFHPGDSALQVRYNGFGSRTFAEQFLQLAPGRYSLTGNQRTETLKVSGGVSWTIACYESRQIIAETRRETTSNRTDWQRFSVQFTVPPQGCSAQWIRLVPHIEDRRETIVTWYDKLSIVPGPE